MDANSKRRRLAALEGQLSRWHGGKEPRLSHRRVLAEAKALRALPGTRSDGDLPRRIATGLARLAGLKAGSWAFGCTATLLRMDCILWQKRLSRSLDAAMTDQSRAS